MKFYLYVIQQIYIKKKKPPLIVGLEMDKILGI